MDEQSADRPDQYRITRVYTRGGDRGTSELVGGQRVPKNHPRFNAYGTVDELQVAVGAARDALHLTLFAHPDRSLDLLRQAGPQLIYVQQLLFTLSGDLATRVEDRWADMPLPTAEQIDYMENLIDALNESLPPLKDFILPGGHPAATAVHACRVICRRAEREVETLAAVEPVGDLVRPMLNRLSDLFFVLARRIAHELNLAGLAPEEIIWRRDATPPPLP